MIKSETFANWVDGLRDRVAVARIEVRIARMADGNPGDVKPLGNGISEMRVNYGPGYRVYFLQRGDTVVILLCGGDKSTQNKDVTKAYELAEEWKQNG